MLLDSGVKDCRGLSILDQDIIKSNISSNRFIVDYGEYFDAALNSKSIGWHLNQIGGNTIVGMHNGIGHSLEVIGNWSGLQVLVDRVNNA